MKQSSFTLSHVREAFRMNKTNSSAARLLRFTRVDVNVRG